MWDLKARIIRWRNKTKNRFEMLPLLQKTATGFLAVLLCGAFLSVSAYADAQAEGVQFADPVFEQMLRSAMGRPSGAIYPEELAVYGAMSIENSSMWIADTGEIERLILEEHAYPMFMDTMIGDVQRSREIDGTIKSVQDLSYFTGLRYLWIEMHPVQDISKIAHMTDLTFLSLAFNDIDDISPLAGLTELRILNLMNNKVNDISPLANLTKLHTLILGGNLISNVSPIKEIKSLINLSLSNNQISDLTQLTGLVDLQVLNLAENEIRNVGPLQGLQSLKRLILDGNAITDWSPVAHVEKVQGRPK